MALEEGPSVPVRAALVSERADGLALAEYPGELDDLYNRAPCGYHSLDADGTFVRVNDTELAWLGYAREEVVGRLKLTDLLTRDAPAELPRLLHEGTEQRMAKGIELELVRKDGRRLSVVMSVTPVRDERGRLVMTRATLFDLSEQRKLEEQVRQSQKMDAMGRLAGGVAHDFNNLLTVINGYTNLAIERLPEGHPALPDLTEVRRAGERAADLTRQLLALSRKQVARPRPLDLNEVVSDIDRMLRPLLGEQVRLIKVAGGALGTVRADPGQLEQLLVNLVVNARDAMPHGGRVTIETRNVELDDSYVWGQLAVQAGSYVLLAVSDTGIGMDSGTQARIFEPFFTTKEKGKGTGLGLTNVYGIVQQCSGTIRVYSVPGRGTTFKIYLPRVWEPPRPRSGPALPLLDVARATETILLVEDDEPVRDLAALVLRRAGYTVLSAGDPRQALSLLDSFQGSLHALVTDVVMPGSSGPQVFRDVSARRPGIRVLYMSGYTEEAIAGQGALDESAAFLEKPFAPEALLRSVREVLNA